MPKFVAVTDPEKALTEQKDDPNLAKHRAWESQQYVTVNRTGDNLLPSSGAQECIAMARKTTGKQKMVLKNGLWVKEDVPAAPKGPSHVSKGGTVFQSRNEFGEKIGGPESSLDEGGQNERSDRHDRGGEQKRGRDASREREPGRSVRDDRHDRGSEQRRGRDASRERERGRDR